jgi:diacylglycerol kinase family enzyme
MTPTRRRLAALLALAAYVAAFVVVIKDLASVVAALGITLVTLAAASVTAWFALTRRGAVRLVSTLVTVLLLVVPVVALLAHAVVIDVVVVIGLLALATLLTRAAVGVDRGALRSTPPPGAPVPAPLHPVLLMNPWSGGGKVEKFHLEHEARRRGIEPVVLQEGDDLESLARDAVARGADALGMAGGDGSQAIVAGVAMEHDLPFVCIPAGTRNHLALDLGVDRDDVVGSLEAFIDGYERRIDLGLVNGRVFVNNVSLGVYAEIVQSDAYRDQKLKTTGDMLPDLFGPGSEKFDFELDSVDGPLDNVCMVLVSNNVYELERLGGFGTRAHIDEGVLGVVAVEVQSAGDVAQLVTLELAGRVGTFSGWHHWSVPVLEVRSSGDVAAGVDGEALVLPAPLRFEIVPGALRVRVAQSAPGVSPARAAHAVRAGGFAKLLRVASGRSSE